jgi:hypothetical protein
MLIPLFLSSEPFDPEAKPKSLASAFDPAWRKLTLSILAADSVVARVARV